MSKYDPLRAFLLLTPQHLQDMTVSFDQISKIINTKLPASATAHRQWWENQSDTSDRPQNQTWIDAGFEVKEVNLQQRWVKFKKI